VDEILTIDEMKARYAPDWVLIGDPVVDEGQRLLAGRVLFHSPDREAIYARMDELPGDRFGVRFLGERPKDMVFVL